MLRQRKLYKILLIVLGSVKMNYFPSHLHNPPLTKLQFVRSMEFDKSVPKDDAWHVLKLLYRTTHKLFISFLFSLCIMNYVKTVTKCPHNCIIEYVQTNFIYMIDLTVHLSSVLVNISVVGISRLWNKFGSIFFLYSKIK